MCRLKQKLPKTKTQAIRTARLGCDVVESTFDTWGYFFVTKMPQNSKIGLFEIE